MPSRNSFQSPVSAPQRTPHLKVIACEGSQRLPRCNRFCATNFEFSFSFECCAHRFQEEGHRPAAETPEDRHSEEQNREEDQCAIRERACCLGS